MLSNRAESFNLKYLLFLLIAITVLKNLVFIGILPAWQGPDESSHFAQVQFLAEEKSLPVYKLPYSAYSTDYSDELRESLIVNDSDHIAFKPENIQRFLYKDIFPKPGETQKTSQSRHVNPDNYRNNTLAYSPLFYGYGAIFYTLGERFDVEKRMYLVRFGATLLMIPFVLYSFLLGRLLFDDHVIALSLSAFVSFHPMVTFAFTMVNNDSLLLTASAGAVYYMAAFYKDGMKHDVLKAGLALAIAILAKPHGLVLAAGLLVLLASRLLKGWSIPWRDVLLSLLLLTLMTAPWFIYCELHYGNILGPGFSSLDVTEAKYEPPSLLERFNPLFFRWPFTMFVSFWGNFGHLDTPIPHNLTIVLWGTYIAAFAAITIFAIKIVARREFGDRMNALFISFLLVVYIFDIALAFFLYPSLMYEGGQGRYYFAVWLPMASILFFTLVKLSPDKYARLCAITASLLMLCYFIYALFGVVTARYYL